MRVPRDVANDGIIVTDIVVGIEILRTGDDLDQKTSIAMVRALVRYY